MVKRVLSNFVCWLIFIEVVIIVRSCCCYTIFAAWRDQELMYLVTLDLNGKLLLLSKNHKLCSLFYFYLNELFWFFKFLIILISKLVIFRVTKKISNKTPASFNQWDFANYECTIQAFVFSPTKYSFKVDDRNQNVT